MPNPFNTARPASTEEPATERAINYLRDLMLDKAVHQGHAEEQAARDVNSWLARHRGKAEVSENIDRLKSEGYTGSKYRGRKTEFAGELEDGFYLLAGVDQPIRVIHAIHGSGYQYARALDPATGKWDVKIEGALGRIAREGVRIDTDPEKSAELGKLYGICMVCGTPLTDKSPGGSIELGIGPVCRAKRGW
jgi:hypothetical protein